MEADIFLDDILDLNSLDMFDDIYMPGSLEHTRIILGSNQLGAPLGSLKSQPVFQLHTVQRTPRAVKLDCERPTKVYTRKYSFLKSLDSGLCSAYCDTEALYYRDNFDRAKDELVERLYEIFNEDIFNNKLYVTVVWSKLLRVTAGKCINQKSGRMRTCLVELSLKVLTSANRLRCTLLHEMCHAAAWVFNGNSGHGAAWKKWAQRANKMYSDLPRISVYHDYKIEFKYTYKCHNCHTSSHFHSRSRKLDKVRSCLCRGPITLYLNKKNKHGNIVPTLSRRATGFAKFVKDNFRKFKRDGLSFGDTIRVLSAKYAQSKAKGLL